MKKLTIGSAVYDDFDGIYFSYQSIRLNNIDILDDLDLVVIDNNPNSKQGLATADFCKKTNHIRYIKYTDKRSTSIRNEIFKNAQAPFCMSIDPHVLFEANTIKELIRYVDKKPRLNDLLHGPMFYDLITGALVAKMDPVWRNQMFGTWAYDERANDPNGPPFEIEMHGLGVFCCRTDAWLGFNEHFTGFGGEEGYIHKKFKKAGQRVWCLPFLRWLHRFQRPNGVPYPLKAKDKFFNYLVGAKDLGLPFDDIIEHFSKEIPNLNLDEIINSVSKLDLNIK